MARSFFAALVLAAGACSPSPSSPPVPAAAASTHPPAVDAGPPAANAELQAIYDADQADRDPKTAKEGSIMDRDIQRRAQVDALLARGVAKTSADYFHAAMVWQHGSTAADIERAHELALKAMAIEPAHPKARWLAAASEDRVHMYKEEPQRFGTQFRVENGTWVLYKYDPSVTDEERAKWGVPPISEAQKRVEILNKTMPPPKDLDFRDAGAPASGDSGDAAAYGATLGRFLSERLTLPTTLGADAQRTLCAIYEVKISRTMVIWHVTRKATKPSGNDVFDEAARDVFVRLMNDKTPLPAPPKSLDDYFRGRSAAISVLGKNASPGLCIPIK